jgi:hypothetical protein
MIMTESEKTDTTEKTPKRLLFATGIVVMMLALEGIAIGVWLTTRPEPPQTVLMQDFNDLQADFTAEQVKLKESLRQNKQLQTQCASLQRKHNGLNQKLSLLIAPETLPEQVRGQTKEQSLERIQTLCRTAQQLNPRNVGALLAVLQEIHENGVIYTGLEVKNEERKALYTQIQTLLNAIKVFNGPITGQSPDTLKAVKDFQTQRQLKVDGKIGIKTFLQIIAEFESTCLNNMPAPSSVQLAASPKTTKPQTIRPRRIRR